MEPTVVETMETATAAAAAPLLQVQVEKTTMRVMVAIDESEGSLYALRWALDHLFRSAAQIPEDSGMVTIVHVQAPLQTFIYPFGPGPAVYAPSPAMDSVRKVQEENTASILERALRICKDKNIKVETLIMDGDPKEMLCEATEQMQVDIVVVGSRGLGKLKRAFLGSVSDYCAHHAKCPILIVKPPKEKDSPHSHRK